MVRAVLLALVLVPAVAAAKPKPAMLELKSVPSSPKAIAALLATEKPGKFRDQLVWSLEAKLREKGTELTDSEQVDALTTAMFERIFADMAAPTDVWTWTGDDGPRGDVLIREKVKLVPARNSSTYSKPFNVTPKGKRIDRGYLNEPLTVQVSVAPSEAEWHQWVETKGWGGWVHPVLATDGVARVVISLFSPGKEGAAWPRHERPVWIGFFQQTAADQPWTQVLFDPTVSKEQRHEESNLMPGDSKMKPTDAQKKLILALRLEDLRMVNPARTAFLGKEASFFNLGGLTECPVDTKTVAWLDPYRTSDHPLVRAAAVIKAAQLGGQVTPAELLEATTSKIVPVQVEAFAALEKVIGASTEVATESDKAALSKLGGAEDVKIWKDVARVKAGKATLFFKRGESGWDAIATPKK